MCPQLNDEEQTDVLKGSETTRLCGGVWFGTEARVGVDVWSMWDI